MSMEQHVALVHIKSIMEVILQPDLPFSVGFGVSGSLIALTQVRMIALSFLSSSHNKTFHSFNGSEALRMCHWYLY